MSTLVRRQLGQWAARYRALTVALIAAVVLVVVFPSVAPEAAGFGEVAGPAPVTTAPRTPAVTVPPAAPGLPFAGPVTPPVVPVGGSPGALAPPPPVVDDAVPCPIDLPTTAGATQALPLADVLNIASPALPLLGPFIPFAVAGLPLGGPVLNVVTPLLPVGEPVFVFLGPIAADALGPLAAYEAILLEPVAAPIEDFTPQALEAQQAFIAQLQPAINQISATGLDTCGVIVVGSLAGIVQQAILDLGLDDLLDQLLGALG